MNKLVAKVLDVGDVGEGRNLRLRRKRVSNVGEAFLPRHAGLSTVFIGCLLLIVGCGEVQNEPAKAEGPNGEVKKVAPAVSKSVPQGWTEDFETAKATAKKEGKKILVAFSGSDWCCWCVKLEEETFSKKEFVELAGGKYVLVMIDLPSDESKLSELAKKQNRPLSEAFNVQGFPHAIVLDSDGAELGHIGGYIKGGPKAYFEAMENCRPGPLAK